MISWGVMGFIIVIVFTFFYKCCCEGHLPMWRPEQSHLDEIATVS
jgi:hypothetical protein